LAYDWAERQQKARLERKKEEVESLRRLYRVVRIGAGGGASNLFECEHCLTAFPVNPKEPSLLRYLCPNKCNKDCFPADWFNEDKDKT